MYFVYVSLQQQQPVFPIARLSSLCYSDLSRNYLNGTIPKEWGSLNLVYMYAFFNFSVIFLPINLYRSNYTNTLDFKLWTNLGNLPNIQRLLLTSNNFTGELPATFARLTTLQEVRLGDNNFSGNIPDFIQSWTSLQKLVIQGTGLSGPVPSGISLLESLTDLYVWYLLLRISDLNGFDYFPFPQLNNLKNLEILILRSCNINGTIPEYLGTISSLQTLDLSFNKLSGLIPSSFEYGLRKTDY
ncbi:putative LRR receptor-like serine/threonine-protein kinase, partial [Mucuna pruriens]